MSETPAKGAKHFEDLRVFQQARSLANQTYALTRNSSFSRDHCLRDQVRRSAVSVLSNIAEGFEWGTKRSFIHALTIAKGSCGELRAQLTLALDQNYLDASEYTSLAADCRRLSGGISKLISYLSQKP